METCKNHTNKGTKVINIDGKLITNQQTIANSFNNYFVTVADKTTSNIKNDKTSLNCNNPIHCLHRKAPLFKYETKIYSTQRNRKKIIKSLKSKNSHVCDGIPMKILKVSTPFITSLTYICNKSVSSGTFPS